MAQIRSRGGKRETYVISIYVGRDSSGKKITHNETFYGPESKAKKRAQQLEVELKAKIGPKGFDRTIGEAIDKWLKTKKKKNVYVRTYQNYELQAKRLKSVIGDLRFFKTTSEEIDDRLQSIDDVAPRTKRDLIVTACSILRKSVTWGFTNKDLAVEVTVPEIKKVKREMLGIDRLELFIETAKGYKHYLPLKTAAVSGMRIGEVLGLKWCNLDLDKGVLVVKEALDIKNRWSKDTKTENSKRTISLDEEFLLELREFKKKVNPSSEDDYVFKSEDGTGRALNYPTVLKTKGRVLKKAGLPLNIRLHDLRHNVASIMVDNNVPLTVVADQLGDSLATIAKTYAHSIRQGKTLSPVLKSDKVEAGNPRT